MGLYNGKRDLRRESLRRFISRTPDKIELGPPVKTVEDYADEDLLQRQNEIVMLNMDRRWVPPIVSRVQLLYTHLVEKALYASERIALQTNVSDIKSIQRLKLEVCKHILALDYTSGPSRAFLYKCVNATGSNLTAAVTELLQGTIYHRYRYYVSKRLTTLEFSKDPFIERYWRRVSYLLTREEAEMTDESKPEVAERRHFVAQTPMLGALEKVAVILDIDFCRIRDAIKAFMKCLRSAENAAAPELSIVLQRSLELEDLCRSGDHQNLARMLHRDYWTMHKMLKLMAMDDEIVHLQSVISQMAAYFFGQNVGLSGKRDVRRKWRPRSIFWMQKWLLENNLKQFMRNRRRAFRAKAESAENGFKEAWESFNDIRSTYHGPAGPLLEQHLSSLGVNLNNISEDEELAGGLAAFTVGEHQFAPKPQPAVAKDPDSNGDDITVVNHEADKNNDEDEDGDGDETDNSESDEDVDIQDGLSAARVGRRF